MTYIVAFVVILGIGLALGFTLGYLAMKTHPQDGNFNIEEDLDRNLANRSFREMQLEATRIFDVIKTI